VDAFHHFEHEPLPARDMDPAFLELHRKITERNAQILYRGTDVRTYDDPKALPDNRAS
jgi:non-haem Fe2+, alpha-ketoglutarate-dependent halogenase